MSTKILQRYGPDVDLDDGRPLYASVTGDFKLNATETPERIEPEGVRVIDGYFQEIDGHVFALFAQSGRLVARIDDKEFPLDAGVTFSWREAPDAQVLVGSKGPDLLVAIELKPFAWTVADFDRNSSDFNLCERLAEVSNSPDAYCRTKDRLSAREQTLTR